MGISPPNQNRNHIYIMAIQTESKAARMLREKKELKASAPKKASTSSTEDKQFSAVVISIIGERTKSNDNVYQLVRCEATNPDTGRTALVFAQRTILKTKDVDGEELAVHEDKSPVGEGDEVILYARIVDGKPFFEVSLGESVDTDEDIVDALWSDQ
jgi:hypothetical protein